MPGWLSAPASFHCNWSSGIQPAGKPVDDEDEDDADEDEEGVLFDAD